MPEMCARPGYVAFCTFQNSKLSCNSLCYKSGAGPSAWEPLHVQTYDRLCCLTLQVLVLSTACLTKYLMDAHSDTFWGDV